MSGSHPTCRQKRGPAKVTDAQIREMVMVSGLTPNQRSTLILACHGLYRDTLIIRISFGRLAALIGIQRRQTINRMRSLERTGVIEKVQGGGGRYENGRGRLNTWRLDLDALLATGMQPKLPENDEPTPVRCVESCTLNGATGQRERCKIDASTVQEVAQDPSPPIPSKKESKANTEADPSKHHQPAVSLQTNPIDDLRPWVNRYDPPQKTRADRIEQIRSQLAFAEKHPLQSSEDPVQFSQEGSDG